MTTLAFQQGLPFAVLGKYIVNIGLIFFAFTTIIGWNYYGERCIEYLIGVKGIKLYKFVFIVFVGVGPFLSLDLVFIIADIVNGLMALPNLVGLIALRHVVINETNEFFEKLNEESKIAKDNKLQVNERIKDPYMLLRIYMDPFAF